MFTMRYHKTGGHRPPLQGTSTEQYNVHAIERHYTSDRVDTGHDQYYHAPTSREAFECPKRSLPQQYSFGGLNPKTPVTAAVFATTLLLQSTNSTTFRRSFPRLKR